MKQNGRQKKHVTRRIVICAFILALGWLGMKGLIALKKPPAEATVEERAIRVEALIANPADHAVVISGLGETSALTVVTVAPEVSGRIIYTHPSLHVGERIPKDAVLFRIDPADYEARLLEARAGVTQREATVARLRKQMAIDTQRLKTMQRNAQLAKREFQRVKRLFETDRVGTRSGVEQAERAYNSAADQADQMEQTVSLYPLQIEEAQSGLLSARARLTTAEINLSRCTVKATFDARVESESVEKGQYVSPGRDILTLADDTTLEIQVPLDSRDVHRWMQFDRPSPDQMSAAWFLNPTPVACTIRWTEDQSGNEWTGRVDRVVAFDRQTRTITVAIRISAREATGNGKRRFPLVDGMFCSVEIPGRILHDVYRLPRHTVSFENEIYLVGEKNRLKTVDVRVERIEGNHVFVSQGLQPGSRVILTRLVDPLENALLEIVASEKRQEPAS